MTLIKVFDLKMMGLLMAAMMFGLTAVAPAHADSALQNAWSNQIIRQAVIGAAAGGVTGAVSDRASVGKGVMVGGIAGAGSGALNRVNTLNRHPLVKSGLQGAILGTGASYVLDSSKVKGAAIGAGAGAATYYVRDYLNRR